MIGFFRYYFGNFIGSCFRIRRKPRVIQLPITSKCNSRCVTCNIWKHKDRKDIDFIELKQILRNPFFSKVRAVGINGGEPTLHSNFKEVVESVLILPKLKSIFVISNCINSEKLLIDLKEVYPLCHANGVHLHLQISIDGIGDTHNFVRGINVSFERSMQVIDELYKNQSVYLDGFDIGFTISKYNVDDIVEVDEFFSQYNIPVYYHLAVPNKRIHNFEDATFSVLTDKHATQMAKEFFLNRSQNSQKTVEKIRYYLTYMYLAGKTRKRLFVCDYLYQDITINENLDVFLCATASEQVGNLKNGMPAYRKYNQIAADTKKHCNTCIHYGNIPTVTGILIYLKEKLSTYKWLLKFKYSV